MTTKKTNNDGDGLVKLQDEKLDGKDAANALDGQDESSQPAAKKPAASKKLSDGRRKIAPKTNAVQNAPKIKPEAEFDEPPEEDDSKKNFAIDSAILKAQKQKKKRKVAADIEKAERYDPPFEQGLTAKQVEKRNEEGYTNFTCQKKGKTYKSIIFSNIFTFFNILTFVVGGTLITTAMLSSEKLTFGDMLAKLFFLFIITANILVGVIQEIRSKRMIDKLTLVAAPSATVVRGGEKKAVPINDIVLDDVIFIETGKQISADAVVLSGFCEVNESMLTGESEPMKKTMGDKLYSGSYVSSGACYARVDKIGDSNYVETLTSHAKRYRKPQSELQKSIKLIIKIVTCVIIPVTAFMLVEAFSPSLTSAARLSKISKWAGAAIGMIPAGMFLLTSAALFMGVIRLARRNTLVQDLYCIEMLARADVLCLDKTGTITDGSMQVNKVVTLFKEDNAEGKLSRIIGSMLTATGDNNQTALALAAKFGYNTQMKPVRVSAFSSARKYSAATFLDEGTFVLGAPEFVLRDMGIKLEKLVSEYASQGYRVLCLAEAAGDITVDGKVPSSRRPLALLVIEDHIREDAVETIRWFKENDVAVKIISGDNPITVSEVAKRVGVENGELFISLDGLSSQEVIEAADKYTVFGRVTPEQKSLLVRAIKAKGHTVAMTGDGVNDILAMKEADCSIAIASGAEAARNVSHLVLLDSNFTSMPDVVIEGRRVVNNITKTSSLFLTKTFMSVVLSLIFILIKQDYPFGTNNLLMLEMFVIAIPSAVLVLQPNNNRIKGNFIFNVISRAVPGGLALVISIMAVHFYSRGIIAKGWVVEADFAIIQTSLWVLALSFTGLVVLAKICEPFNFYRGFVFVVSLVLMSIAMSIPKVSESFGIAKLQFFASKTNMMHLFFLVATVLSAYFIITWLMKMLKALNIMVD